MTNTEYQEYLHSEKWANICKQRMRIDKYRCTACGTAGNMANPLEIHHLSYSHLGHEEERIYEDLVTVCRSCHKLTHTMMERVTSPTGRKGWKDNPRIPQVHTFTYSGADEDRNIVIGSIAR